MRSLHVIVMILIPYTIFAQNWTAEQQEVIDQVKKSFEAWNVAVFDQKDYSLWTDKYAAKDYHFWWLEDGAPTTRSGDISEARHIPKQYKRIHLKRSSRSTHFFSNDMGVYKQSRS